jgi:hypothetical protein
MLDAVGVALLYSVSLNLGISDLLFFGGDDLSQIFLGRIGKRSIFYQAVLSGAFIAL